MDISVIIPTYKPSDYLWECLESLTTQTYPFSKFEVIIILNGCKEPYLAQISNFIDRNKIINWKLVQTHIPGVSNARNIGINIAQGEYFVFIDDDDFISSDYLAELHKLAKTDIISLCYPLAFDDGTNKYESYVITKAYDFLETKGKVNYKKGRKFLQGPAYKMIHKSVIGERRYNTKFTNGEDSLFMFLISDKFKFVEVSSKNAIYYRRRRTNSANFKKQKFSKVLLNCLALIAEYSKIFFSAPQRYSFNFYVTRILGTFHTIIKAI